MSLTLQIYLSFNIKLTKIIKIGLDIYECA